MGVIKQASVIESQVTLSAAEASTLSIALTQYRQEIGIDIQPVLASELDAIETKLQVVIQHALTTIAKQLKEAAINE